MHKPSCKTNHALAEALPTKISYHIPNQLTSVSIKLSCLGGERKRKDHGKIRHGLTNADDSSAIEA